MITEIKGDITKVKCDYICQQNNCIAVKPHGLSLTIAREMGVCPYSRRRADGKKNLAIEEDRHGAIPPDVRNAIFMNYIFIVILYIYLLSIY